MTVTLRELHIAGTGSFALEVVEYAREAGFSVAGLVELVDEQRIGTEIHGLPVVASENGGGAAIVIALGGDRLSHWAQLSSCDWSPVAVVHPRAQVSSSAVVGPGAVVGPLSVLGAAAELGAHVLVGRGALVGHHTVVEAGATLNPGANVAGNSASAKVRS